MNDRELEKVIDEALAAYVPEPRSGIALRVLARVDGSRRKAVLALAGAFAAIALLVLVLLPRRLDVPAPAPKQVAVNVPRGTPSAHPPPQLQRRRRMRRAASPPKRELFPTPRPLSDEARLLVALVRESPERAERLLTFEEPAPIKPLVIEEIEIKPLEGETE